MQKLHRGDVPLAPIQVQPVAVDPLQTNKNKQYVPAVVTTSPAILPTALPAATERLLVLSGADDQTTAAKEHDVSNLRLET